MAANAGLIAGIIILVLVILAALGIAIVLLRRRKLRALHSHGATVNHTVEGKELTGGYGSPRVQTVMADFGTHRADLQASFANNFVQSTNLRPDIAQFRPYERRNSISTLHNPFEDNLEEASLLLSNPHSDDTHSFEDRPLPQSWRFSASPQRAVPQDLPPLDIPGKPKHADPTNPSMKSVKPEYINEIPGGRSRTPSPSPSAYSQASAAIQRTLTGLTDRVSQTPPPEVPPLPPLPNFVSIPIPQPAILEHNTAEPESEVDLHRVPTEVISKLLKSRRGANRSRIPTLGEGFDGVEHIERSGSIVSHQGGGTQRRRQKFEGMHSLAERIKSETMAEEEEEDLVSDDEVEREVLDPRIASYYEADLEGTQGLTSEVRPLSITKR